MDDSSKLFRSNACCLDNMGDSKTMKKEKHEYTSVAFIQKVSKKIHDIRGDLIKETQKEWTLSKVLNLMILYSIQHGVTKESLKKMESQYEDGS